MRPLFAHSAVLALVAVAACSQPIDADGPIFGTTSDTSETPMIDPTGDPSGNQAPVADAGLDIDAIVTDPIPLDGSGSYDPDGDTLEYEWSFITMPIGSSATLINETRDEASFYADIPGVYLIELVVRDGSASASDQVQVNVAEENEPPVANAGPDQNVDVGDTVLLNGSNSYDPDGDALTFSWTIAGAPGASSSFLDSPASALTEFVPDVSGTYIVQLVVSDGISTSAVDSVLVTAVAGGGNGGGGGGTSGTCFSCAAQLQHNPRGLALGLAPIGLVFLRRRSR